MSNIIRVDMPKKALMSLLAYEFSKQSDDLDLLHLFLELHEYLIGGFAGCDPVFSCDDFDKYVWEFIHNANKGNMCDLVDFDSEEEKQRFLDNCLFVSQDLGMFIEYF